MTSAVLVLIAIAACLGLWRWLSQRKPPAPSLPATLTPLDFPHEAPRILHLLDKLTERPVCGASIREAWTILPDTATCTECKKQSESSMLQWWANNR